MSRTFVRSPLCLQAGTPNAIDSYACERTGNWLCKKHRIGRQRLRGAASVRVSWYRYRGLSHPDPVDTATEWRAAA